MKFTNKIRVGTMVMGLGGALLLGNAVYAQQETDPTTFDVNPGVPQQQAAVPAASNLAVAYVAPVDNSAAASEQMSIQEAGAAQWTEVDTLTMMAAILAIAFVILHGIAETRNARNSQIPA